MPRKGFTIIESLVYLALLGLVFAGLMSTAFVMIENIDRVKIKTGVQEEANFLLAKIGWAVNSAVSATATSSPPSLTLIRTDVPATVFFDLDAANNFRLNGQPINSSAVGVQNLVFGVTATDSLVTAVNVSFTVKTKISTGRDYYQDFSLTTYLHK